jgi:NAD(P)-dependent dehydrogenase (short-subunit alcohol dehydrogenase family)
VEDFTGKVVIVTGSGSGIGRATAQQFAKANASVIVADLNIKAADETVRLITQERGGEKSSAVAIECDIAQESSVRNLISASVEIFGQINVLVNNAARFLYKGGFEASEGDWNAVMRTNVAGAALCSRYAAAEMIKTGGGAIVIVSSTSGLEAAADYATYCSSKAALLMLTRCLALDFGRYGIRVNSVCPGPVDTPALRRELERTHVSWEEFEEFVYRKQSIKKMLQPEDVGRSILFLSSDSARTISGANLVVDGGFSAGE